MFQLKSWLTGLEVFSRVEARDSVTRAASGVESSHEPILVYQDEKYVGLTSLAKLMFDKRLPPQAKVGRYLVPVPHLPIDTDLFTLVHTMLSTRLYSLPVWDDSQLTGMVEAAKIYEWAITEPGWLSQLAEAVQIDPPTTILPHTSVGEAYELLKGKDMSHLVVTNADGQMMGLITRRDLRPALVGPTNRQRYKNFGGQPLSFDPTNPVTRQNKTVDLVMETHVYSLTMTDKTKMLQDLIESDYNSVVVVDGTNRPTGLISNWDILEGIYSLRPAG